MKKILSVLVLTAIFSLAFVNKNYAQDQWYQNRNAGIYSIGIGGTDGINVGGNGFNAYNIQRISYPGASINASGEYKVYKFIGVGWQSGINIIPWAYAYGYGTSGLVTIEIPFIAKCNVHILDAVGGVAIADKLDVYAGLGFGGGPAILTGNGAAGNNNTTVYGIIHVGPQVGIRYWIIPKVAIFGEFGWGATFANAGVTF